MVGPRGDNSTRGALPLPPHPPARPDRIGDGFRVALFSGNYNCIRDGANNALNRLAGYLLGSGAAFRAYSPTVQHPAFAPVGDLVSVPSIPIPRRPEYRLAIGLGNAVREDVRHFGPTIVHLSAPDILGRQAQHFARKLGVPVVASLHTRFETYFDYYGLGAIRGMIERYLRRFYQDCDLVLAPNGGIAEILDGWGIGDKVRIWGRGVDRALFTPARRDREWRRSQGYGDEEVVLLFFGRLVPEKGLEIFAKVVERLRSRGRHIRPLVVGTGPQLASFTARLGDAVFTGHLEGPALARAIASADILLNPSLTEAFGNVNLEAMASGLTVVSADVPSGRGLLTDHETGLLVSPDDVGAYADAIEALIRLPLLRRGLAQAAARRAGDFEWSRTLAAVLDAYRELGAISTASVMAPAALAGS